MRNCYDVLGTSSKADGSQLKSAFHKLAKTFHPDLHAGDRRAEERFKEINRAYQVLRDPRTRTAHDAFLAEKRSGARRRTRNAAATMSATFLLSGAFCVALMIWLQGGRFPLARDHETARLAEKATVAPSPRFVSGTDGASDHESGPARLAGASPAEGSGVVLTSGAQEASPGAVQTASNRSDRTRWIMYQRYRAKVALSVPQGVGARDDTEATPLPRPPTPAALAQAERMLDKGQQFLALGNVVIAREYFARAAELGLPIAVLKLGETHDQNEFGSFKVLGLRHEPAEARRWYERAAELGVPEAEARLRRLGSR
jgi:curved DNA-binding protein CbpA